MIQISTQQAYVERLQHRHDETQKWQQTPAGPMTVTQTCQAITAADAGGNAVDTYETTQSEKQKAAATELGPATENRDQWGPKRKPPSRPEVMNNMRVLLMAQSKQTCVYGNCDSVMC